MQLGGEVGLEAGASVLLSLGLVVVVLLGGTWIIAHGARTLLGVSRMTMLPAVTGAWIARRLRARPALTTASGLAHGATVRLRGVVEADALLRATWSGLGVVVCAHACGEPGGAVVSEGLAARDFLVRLSDGTPVRVWARDAAEGRRLRLWDALPHRWNGRASVHGWFRESRVLPGDSIEVVGVLSMQIDPDAPRLGERALPICWTLTAAGGKLLLRFATRAAGATLAAPAASSQADSAA